MKNVHDFGEPSGGGFIDTHFDFKQCRRLDGTIYGIPDKSDCTQKGSKEVSAGTGEGPLLEMRAKMAKSPEKFEKDVLSKLGTSGLDKLAFGLKNSSDPTDKEIAKRAKKLSDKIKKSERVFTKPNETIADAKHSRDAYAAWFKQEGYSNAKYLGRLASLNNLLLQTGIVTDEQFKKNADILKKNNPEEVKKLAGFITVRAKERAPKILEALPASGSKQPSTKPKTTKPKPTPTKPKPSQTWSAGDTKNQYANFYGMLRARGLDHMDAAAAAQDSLRAVARNRNIAIDESMITGELRSQLRKRYK